MAITNKEQGVWILDEVYNKINEGDIWSYTGSNELYGFGNNSKGELGLNDTTKRSSPTQVGTSANWKYLKGRQGSTGGFMGTKTDGSLWSWGYSWGGGNMINQNPGALSSPTQVGTDTTWNTDSRGKFTGPKLIAAAIKTDGSLWSAGYGTKGGPGTGNNTSRSSPVQVPGSWNAVSSSTYTMMATKTDGTLWWWGENEAGSSGSNEGNNTTYNSPRQVGTDTTWHELSSESYSFMGSKTDGTLWAWGSNGSVGLGVNNNVQRSSPTQIGTETTWEISADKFSRAGGGAGAIKTDGTLWMWGQASDGRLGNNAPDGQNQSSPIQLPGTNWSSISCSYKNVLATKSDGTAWAWGKGNDGGLGLNTPPSTKYSSPTQIPGTSWLRASTGRHTGMLITST